MAGWSPIAPRVGNPRRTATRMSMSVGATVLTMAAVLPVSTASASTCPPEKTCPTALVMGGTTVPTPDDAYIQVVKNQYIAPTHPGQDINYVAVTTPQEAWPITGLFRVLATALGPPYAGFDSAVWPDEPWWKLSGLFDLTLDQSSQAGVADLEAAMAAHGNDDLVIYGYSQGANIATREKRKLAEQFPAGTKAPDIDFVLGGDPNLPNGGLWARFPSLHLPIIDWSFDGPEPTDTPFDTVVITRQYDFFADFPLYPLNLVADLNALLGAVYVHMYAFDVSLAPDPSTPPPVKSQRGDTTYYFFPSEDLPLFGPLRTVGVPEPVIDVAEPFFRAVVELGYDRSIPPGEPTPARLIPMHDPVQVAASLVSAIGEGITNARALTGSPRLLNSPAVDTDSDAAEGGVVGSPDTLADPHGFQDDVSKALRTLKPLRTDRGIRQAATVGHDFGRQMFVDRWRKPASTTSMTDRVTFTAPAQRSANGDRKARNARKPAVATNIADPLHQVGKTVEKTVKKASDRAAKRVSGAHGRNVERNG